MNAEISMDDSMRQCIHSLIDVARALVGGKKLIAAEFGDHPGTAWEVRQELLAGNSLLEWSALTPSLRGSIEDLVSEAAELPDSAVQACGTQAFQHEEWLRVRRVAEKFLEVSAEYPEISNS